MLAPFLEHAHAQILRNNSRGEAVPPSPAQERQRRQTPRARWAESGSENSGANGADGTAGSRRRCAFVRVRRGEERSAAEVEAMACLRRARAAATVTSSSCCYNHYSSTPEETQRRVNSFVNRAYFKLDAANQARELNVHRDSGDALRSDAPVNTALFRFGHLLHDLGPKIHMVRWSVEDALLT